MTSTAFSPCSTPDYPARRARWLAAGALLALLAACGGGNTFTAEASGAATSQARTAAAPATDPAAALAQGAALNAAELAVAEKAAQAADDKPAGQAFALVTVSPGEIVAKSAYQSGVVARKAAAQRVTAYRFFNGQTAAHFFTTSETERDNVKNTQSPPFSFEGPAFSVASDFSPGLSPVHRFYNTQTGVHFYTISETERANVLATMPHFRHEGVAYHASKVAGQGLVPFYRFFVPSKGFHFYTANETEKNSIVANLSATYTFEGVGYYVLDADWRAEKLPHTGVTTSQCYKAGSDAMVTCTPTVGQLVMGGTSVDLNPQQDGHPVRRNVNPMSYSVVGTNPITSCVKDDVTGLIWEGKPDDGGFRDKDNTYSNLDNNTASDTSGYVAAVNSAKLCGFNDWRLPSYHELFNLGHFGKVTEPQIDSVWFPNLHTNKGYWSSTVEAELPGHATAFNYRGLDRQVDALGSFYAVRLVRGAPPRGERFSYTTVAYGSDAANNVVNDAWTGLQWRRCEEGRVWSGSACSGDAASATRLTHENALSHARVQAGWRLPNVKEVVSLMDLSVSGSPARIDPVAFPGAAPTYLWSSSPYVGIVGIAWAIHFDYGLVVWVDRVVGTSVVRLVRASQ